jgi:hypothetical protein
MPQRRSFAPNPMQPATTAKGGGRGHAPMPMQPPAQPLPPAQGAGPMPPSTPSPMGGMPAPRTNIPTSIPLTAAQPQGAGMGATPQPMGGPPPQPPQPQGMGQGTVNPLNVSSFLSPMQPSPGHDAQFDDTMGGGGLGGADKMRLPHESATTSADLQGGGAGEDGGDEMGVPMTLLKLLGTMGMGK